jgi:PKD repeat protein
VTPYGECLAGIAYATGIFIQPVYATSIQYIPIPSENLVGDSITISQECPVPEANFTASPTSGCAPLSVQFQDTSTNSPTSWSWDFGDGATSTEQNPGYTYNAPGTYNVSLTAQNNCGNDSKTEMAYIVVQNCAPPPEDLSSSWSRPHNIRTINTWVQSQTVLAGQQVIIFANLANKGDIEGPYTATLKINGEEEAVRTGMLQGNTAVPLEFVVSRDKPGTYQVDVNGRTTFFTVIEDSNHSESTSKNRHVLLLLWGLLLMALIIALAILIIRRLQYND